jgi:hypothetical protein
MAPNIIGSAWFSRFTHVYSPGSIGSRNALGILERKKMVVFPEIY